MPTYKGGPREQRLANRPKQKQVGHAITWWVAITMSGILCLAALSIWHIIRRGQRLRERLGPPREILWPDLTPTQPRSSSRDAESHQNP
jgi:hypothetical protein